MNQNEVLLSGETGPVGSIGAGPAERIQSEQETALEEQTETGTASTEQTDPAFRWDKIATWPPDVAIFFIVAGTALCLLRSSSCGSGRRDTCTGTFFSSSYPCLFCAFSCTEAAAENSDPFFELNPGGAGRRTEHAESGIDRMRKH